jgi:hypothetical protein
MAISNYATGEMLDRLGMSARGVAVGIGAFFLIPGGAWFATRRWWDKKQRVEETPVRANVGSNQELMNDIHN